MVHTVRERLTEITRACWMLIDLAIHPEWKEKCKKEIQGLLSRHPGDSLSSTTLSEKFGGIPVSAWEDELPTLDAAFGSHKEFPLPSSSSEGTSEER